MNKNRLVDLFRTYEQSLIKNSRNKSAENAFVSELYTAHGKTRPAVENVAGPLKKNTLEEFKSALNRFVTLLRSANASVNSLATAEKRFRQSTLDYYHGVNTEALNKARQAVKNVLAAWPRSAPARANRSAEAGAIVNQLKKLANAKYPGAKNRLRRRLGPRTFNSKWNTEVRTRLPSDMAYVNFVGAMNALRTGYRSNTNLRTSLEAILKNVYKPKKLFSVNFPNISSDPKFRDIMRRTTQKAKKFQVGPNPQITPSNAQYQLMKTRSSFGRREFYGNMKAWNTIRPEQYNNLTNLQKNAIMRIKRSRGLNKYGTKVKYGPNRYELTNALLGQAGPNNAKLANLIAANITRRSSKNNY